MWQEKKSEIEIVTQPQISRFFLTLSGQIKRFRDTMRKFEMQGKNSDQFLKT